MVHMHSMLSKAIQTYFDTSEIVTWKQVYGGDINESFYIRTASGSYFIKIQAAPPPRFFHSEKSGLDTIRLTKTISVPNVFHVYEDGEVGCLILEWISGKKTEQAAEKLGALLALMHNYTGEKFGFANNGYIGKLPQPNQWFDSWIDYYRTCRLQPQIRLAEEKGLLPLSIFKKLNKLMQELEQWIPEKPKASLLHGDLWSGNWMAGENGEPYLIDPSVFYGHDEFELAFTELFGGFPAGFYHAYQEVNPLSKDYEDRKELYQLFYLLVHLNLFGKSYVNAVERIVNRYV
ncbi:fructosamine kinase family protein [Anoxybacteroides rupiense]|uniref:fructosamine kinase family protein n=1 Tax=Anoxybacteroides rupiense TaxID=311460 RepID=UPI001606450B|nr:fructosamine kinase family protein [Anoxybacillus rupiensis]